jgi:hypothetical protein
LGAYIDYDPATGRQKVTETFTCPHHNTIHPRYDEQGKRIDVAMCRKCMRAVCDECVKVEASGGNMCVHVERRLEDYERGFRRLVDRNVDRGRRAAELLRACGLA